MIGLDETFMTMIVHTILRLLLASALLAIIQPAAVGQRTDGTHCAFEGELCSFQGTQDVSYGAQGKWITKTATGSIKCGVAAFGGDPGSGGRRSCKINAQKPPAQDGGECAKEGERCGFLGTSEVAYGAGNRWVTKTATKSIQCGVAAFGTDPAPNVHKTCVIVPTRCAGEGELCAFSGFRTVKYGANGVWATNTFKDGITCGVAAFGDNDPVPNVLKQCYLAAPDEKPINQVMWLSAHNAISATYYGFTIQNSQRDSITSQLDRGARSLEIDIVQDTPPGYPEGVYICHCGKAPHSLSAGQMSRQWLSQKPGETWLPISIDGWTHPTPYTRSSVTLKELDKWMIANPGEIVIILLENNNANPTQLDAEIELAGLKTGIYKHNGGKWPTKSSLVAKNQRLIFQVGDDESRGLLRRGDTGESKYVAAKYQVVAKAEKELIIFGWLHPGAYGNSNEYKKEWADDAKSNDKLLIIGSFNSGLTDETTSKAHNVIG